MPKRGFFTPEMGTRLRRIRTQRGLTQVAGRMGLKGKSRWSFISRLEQGAIKGPSLDTVTRYLRACGAQFFEFYDLLGPD